MIVIRVELWPYGNEDAKEEIAHATIVNLGRDGEGHTYRARICENGDPALRIEPMDETVQIVGHDRRLSVWALVERVLNDVIIGRNGIGRLLSSAPSVSD